MTPEQEDALVESSIADATIRTGAISVNFDFRDAIRLAIRAAYAQGREDAATESVEPLVDGWPLYSCIPPLQNVVALADGFGDPETLFNSRDWLQKAVEAKGAKMIGGGIGCGQADIDIELEGCRFNLSLRPIASALDAIPE